MCFDLRKYRIRLSHQVIHALGDPQYIQLLVHPEDMVVAVRAVSKEQPGDQTYRVAKQSMLPGNSFEIYSREFMERLCSVAGDVGSFEAGASYHISGIVIPDNRVALYYLNTVKKLP